VRYYKHIGVFHKGQHYIRTIDDIEPELTEEIESFFYFIDDECGLLRYL